MPIDDRSTTFRAVAAGFGFGVLLELAALFLAILSAGAGHGDYVAARALFPAPMLVSILEGDRIGAVSRAIGLLQFPVYGMVLLWSLSRHKYWVPITIASAHVAAAIICFSGVLPNFS